MDLTQHADARLRQRGFSRFTLHIIQRYGRCENVAGGAIKFFFGNKEHHQAVMELKDRIRPRKRAPESANRVRRTIQLMDRAKGGNIIFKEGRILTVYK